MENEKPGITVQNVKGKLKRGGSHTFEHRKIPALKLKKDEYAAEELYFRHCTFSGEFNLRSVDIKKGCHFDDCTFQSYVDFYDITSDDQENEGANIIQFANCIFLETISLQNTKLHQGLAFIRCKFQQDLSLDDVKIMLQNDILLYECEISRDLNMLRCSVERIQFHANVVKEVCTISGTKGEEIAFYGKNMFQDELLINKSLVKERIFFEGGEYFGEVTIRSCKLEDLGLQINGGTFHSQFLVDYSTYSGTLVEGLETVNIYGAVKFFHRFQIKGKNSTSKLRLDVAKCKIECSDVLQGNLLFEELDIQELNISGYNPNAKISLRNIDVLDFQIVDFINESSLFISNLSAINLPEPDSIVSLSRLTIANTNFGKSQFFQVDFSSFFFLEVSNLILSDISTFNAKWFSSKQLEGGAYSRFEKNYYLGRNDTIQKEKARHELLNWLSSTREIYRQLKFVAIRQGDMPLSHKFQSDEMRLYRKITKFRRPRNWNEYLIMLTNQSNNFGQSWTKPIFLLTLFSFLVYVPIGLLTAPELRISSIAKDWSDVELTFRYVLVDQLRLWLILLNPTHRVSDLSTENLTFWLYFWDFLSRIIVSYFLFQTISAFRKFAK